MAKYSDRLYLSNQQISDSYLISLAQLHKPRVLYLADTLVTDVGLWQASDHLLQLEELALSRTAVTDRSIQYLSQCKQLRTLYLAGTAISDAIFESITSWPNLKLLDLSKTRITDAGFVHLHKAPVLRALDVAWATGLTDVALEHLQDCDQIRELCLKGTQVTDEGLQSLVQMSKLKSVSLVGTKVTPAAIDKLKHSRPELQVYAKSSN